MTIIKLINNNDLIKVIITIKIIKLINFHNNNNNN